MALNLIDLLEQLLGSNEMLSRIGALIGLSPDRVKGAIGAAVPAILASLVGAAQTPQGREQLAGLTRTQDTSLLGNLAGALSGGNEKSLIQTGTGMLSSLLGQGKLDALSGAISKFAALNQSSTGSNLASSLGSAGLLEGVADRLGQGVSAATQASRATAAEAGRAANVATTAAATRAGSAASTARRSGSSMMGWAVGVVVVLAVLWAGYRFLLPGGQMEQAADKAAGIAAQVGEAAKNLMVGDVDLGKRINGVFDSATTTLNDVTDSASAKAAASKLNELDDNLANIKGLADQLPAEGKSALAALVAGALPNLEALITKVSAIPGAGEAIKPITDPMLEKLRAMTA